MRLVGVRPAGRLWWAACALALGFAALLTAGCGGNNNITYGTAVIDIGDVNGDFLSYLIAIDSITLTRSDGLAVVPLSTPEQIDFARLGNITEILSGSALPIGNYTSLTIVLDYSSPSIYADVAGAPTPFAAEDTTGAPMLSETVTVNFDPNNLLVINSGVSTRLHIDFDLTASNTLTSGTTSSGAKIVIAQPFVTASPVPEDNTVFRARGLLVVTQPTSNNYIENIRPFFDVISALGALTVNTSDSTYYNIDGATYTGPAGLAAVGQLQVNTPLAAYGTLGSLSTITPTFNATMVIGGTALESPLADFLTGIVGARSGNTLTLRTAIWDTTLGNTTEGVVEYVDNIPVTIGSDTLVTEDGVNANGLSAQSVSVGQQVTISGTSTINSSTDALESLDATEGLVRLGPTPVWGTLNSATSSSVSLDVFSLGNIEPSLFNFAGTGSTTADNAVASAYTIDTGTFNPSGLAAGTLLQATGVMRPFGSAPADFAASTVTVGTSTPQQLVVEWGSGGSLSPFSSATSAGLVVNLADTHLDTVHYIATGPAKLEITQLRASPLIAFASGTVAFSVGNWSDNVSLFNTASGFLTGLHTALNGANHVYRLVCTGQYDPGSNTFTASHINVNLQN